MLLSEASTYRWINMIYQQFTSHSVQSLAYGVGVSEQMTPSSMAPLEATYLLRGTRVCATLFLLLL